MFKLTLLLILLASSIILVGHATSSPVEDRIAAYQKQSKPTPDCTAGGKRKTPCNRTAPSANAGEEKGERASKAGSKVLFDRTVF